MCRKCAVAAAQTSWEPPNVGSSRPPGSVVNSRGEFTELHSPEVPHWSQIQLLTAAGLMPFFHCVPACVRAPSLSHVTMQSSSTTIGFLLRRSMREPRFVVGELTCRPRKLLLITFLWAFHVVAISIRGIGTDRNFRWSGFGPSAGAGPNEIVAIKRPVAVCGKLKQKPMETRRIARSAQMPLDRSVPHIRRLRHS